MIILWGNYSKNYRIVKIHTQISNSWMRNRQSIRLSGYDYSSPGTYFVTICTQNRKCLFGEITNDQMILNNVGNMINSWWCALKNKFPHIKLDTHIIMPNHIHGTITIIDNHPVGAGLSHPDMGLSHPDMGLSHHNGRGNPAPTEIIITLGKIMAFFKYQTTKQFNELRNVGMQKLWQRNYYERIVRNDSELHKIRQYIKNNPIKWQEDNCYV